MPGRQSFARLGANLSSQSGSPILYLRRISGDGIDNDLAGLEADNEIADSHSDDHSLLGFDGNHRLIHICG